MQRILRYLSLVLVLFSAAPSISGATTSFVVRESIKAAPDSFTKSTSVSLASEPLTLWIQLAHNNIAGLEDELYLVSTPGNAKYGQHLSATEVASYVAPTEETTSLVNQWLQSNNLTAKTVSTAGDWVEISLPASQANNLFNAEFSTYENADGNQVIRTLAYSVPSDLASHISLVYPTVHFPVKGSLPLSTTRASLKPRVSSSCADEMIPSCLQALYSIPTALANSSNPNSLWVSGFGAQYADQTDINAFIEEYRPDIPSTVNTTLAVLEINGGQNSESPSDAGLESMLDTEYTVGMANGIPVTFLSVGPNNVSLSVPDFLQSVFVEADYLVGLDNPPHVLSTSYGADETAITPALANAICNAYMQLGARGTSVIYSSGDGGVTGSQGQLCPGEPFIPAFPSTCPYVTSVGGTQFISNTTTEMAADFSAGGFSNIFSRPSYQSSVVPPYISALGSTYSGLYNTSGRGFPDVSAYAVNYMIILDVTGGLDGFSIDGTSCSAPMFASVIALLNDRLLSAGKSTLGFLNPFLYANPSAFNDILIGNNPGCGTNGFNATAGWDPITGLGTPNFPAIAAAAGV